MMLMHMNRKSSHLKILIKRLQLDIIEVFWRQLTHEEYSAYRVLFTSKESDKSKANATKGYRMWPRWRIRHITSLILVKCQSINRCFFIPSNQFNFPFWTLDFNTDICVSIGQHDSQLIFGNQLYWQLFQLIPLAPRQNQEFIRLPIWPANNGKA